MLSLNVFRAVWATAELFLNWSIAYSSSALLVPGTADCLNVPVTLWDRSLEAESSASALVTLL